MFDKQTHATSGPLSPPLFRDERLSDTARTTYWMLSAVLIATAAFIPIGYTFTRTFMLMLMPVIFASWISTLVTAGITRSGHPVAGARFLVTSTWAITTTFILVTGALESPAMPGLLLVIAFSAILLGW